jgi:anthranilate phosphoribosyltransferase
MRSILKKLVCFENLTGEQARKSMQKIVERKTPNSQIASFFTALRMKKETSEEIAGLAEVMRQHCKKVEIDMDLIDICGTGGDCKNTFNISTAVSFVLAGCGAKVAKHFSKAMSSTCGGADVMERLGLDLNTPQDKTVECVKEYNIGFFYAPVYHPLMKRVSKIRGQIGLITAFNIIGTLCNPAGVKFQLLGVFERELVIPVAEALCELGIKCAFVLHSVDGFDEISIFDNTFIAKVENGKIQCFEISPEDFGIKREPLSDAVKVMGKENCARVLVNVLSGKESTDSPKTKMVCVNASAGLVIVKKAQDFKEGYKMAVDCIRDGRAFEKLKAVIKYCGDIKKLECYMPNWLRKSI